MKTEETTGTGASIAALSAGGGTDITGVAVGGLEQASQACHPRANTKQWKGIESRRNIGEGKEWYKTRGRERSKQILAKAV